MKLSLPNAAPAPSTPSVQEQAAALQLDSSPEEVEEHHPLLPNRFEDRDLPTDLIERLAQLDQIISAEGSIPIDTCRLACKSVMQCLKHNEDTILKLEPEDIQFIVQSYVKTADAESQRVLAGKPKGKKPKESNKVKEAKALVKEGDFDDAF